MNKKEQTKKNSVRGKKSRAAGARFEAKAREDLEKEGWIIARWTNNVEFGEKEEKKHRGKLVKCKPKFNPFTKSLMMNTGGFPDFIAFRTKEGGYEVIGVEVKANGWLDKDEKEKCKWLLNNKIFEKILIAKKPKERGKIEYVDFEIKHGLD